MRNGNKHPMGNAKPKAVGAKKGKKKVRLLKSYSPECYFCCPETGQPGWIIDFPRVKAYSKEEAAEIIMQLPNFDCFIEYGWEKFN